MKKKPHLLTVLVILALAAGINNVSAPPVRIDELTLTGDLADLERQAGEKALEGGPTRVLGEALVVMDPSTSEPIGILGPQATVAGTTFAQGEYIGEIERHLGAPVSTSGDTMEFACGLKVFAENGKHASQYFVGDVDREFLGTAY